MQRRGRLVLICLASMLGCVTPQDLGTLLPDPWLAEIDASQFELIARIAHVTDAQVVDEESPGRFTPADSLIPTAWRPQDSYSTQLFDGLIRAVNRRQEIGDTIDFLIHTGDAIENAQSNELDWFLTCMDGGLVEPLSGLDDRSPEDVPPPELDPHHSFHAQGLYQQDIHGQAPSIPWYAVVGNHDRYGIGVFPIFDSPDGRRIAPFPLSIVRPGIVFPQWLDPEGELTYGRITPAHPGPPPLLNLPETTSANSERRYLTKAELISAHFDTASEPLGHGFSASESPLTWYSASPVEGVRLIVLDTSIRSDPIPGAIYSEGILTQDQLTFLDAKIQEAEESGEVVVLATHHPSPSIEIPGVGPNALVNVLQNSSNVVLHLAGHTHRNRVILRETYVEMETSSVIDFPHEGRLVEVWRNREDGSIELRYEMIGGDEETLGTGNNLLDSDPLSALREQAYELARVDSESRHRDLERARVNDFESIPNPVDVGLLNDRSGRIHLP